MLILFIGDVFGESGRRSIIENVPLLVNKYKIDFVIGNVENASNGRGITLNNYNEMNKYLNCMTLGNHLLANSDETVFDYAPKLIRPYNIYPDLPGVGTKLFKVNEVLVRVTNILGRVFINDLNPDNPYVAIDEILSNNEAPIHIVDFHAEATSEKIAFGHYLDGKVTAVLGTHTHVQTADNKILEHKTAYISDVGMTGPYDSVIGVDKNIIIHNQKTGVRQRHEVASGASQFNAVLLNVDDVTYQATLIKRINIDPFRRED